MAQNLTIAAIWQNAHSISGSRVLAHTPLPTLAACDLNSHLHLPRQRPPGLHVLARSCALGNGTCGTGV